MTRLIVITGPRGTGKTLLASTYARPNELGRVYYHDSENSANQVVEQLTAADLAFGRYVSLKDQFQDLPADDDLLTRINEGRLPWVSKEQKRSIVDYYKHVLRDLEENLERGKYKVYIHDTLEKLEAGMVAWVEENKRTAGVTKTGFGGLWIDGVFPLYEQFLAGLYARGVDTVILCSHLKTPWEGNAPVPGKVIPSGKKILYRLSSLFLWLVNDNRNADGAPAALVLKERMGQLKLDKDGQWKIARMLPRRIPHCTWVDVQQYLENGCDLKDPRPREVMSSEEEAMISELLTDEQLRLMVLGAEKELEELRAQTPVVATEEKLLELPVESPFGDPMSQVRELAATGLSAEEVAKRTNKPLPLVRRWLAEAE